MRESGSNFCEQFRTEKQPIFTSYFEVADKGREHTPWNPRPTAVVQETQANSGKEAVVAPSKIDRHTQGYKKGDVAGRALVEGGLQQHGGASFFEVCKHSFKHPLHQF